MNRKTKILAALTLLSSLAIPIIVVVLNAKILIEDNDFYTAEFEKYGVYENLEGYDVQSINKNAIDFLNSRNQTLPDFFNEREKQHLSDVRSVLLRMHLFLVLSMQIFAAFVVGVLLIARDIKKAAFYSALSSFLGAFITLISALVLFLIASLGFEGSFQTFHSAFFEEGSYTFSPLSERIVVLYPEGLFYDGAVKIALNSIITAIVILVAGGVVLYFTKAKVINKQ